MHTFARLAAVAALTLTAGAASAAPTYLLQRTDGPITVDGVLDESTWAKAAPTSPLRDLSGGPSDYAADIRMAYDDTCLYVAARLPATRLRATLTERGEMWAQYNKYKPIRKQLAKVKPEKRELFEQRHSRELILYDAAARYLKELKASGEELSPKEWRREIDLLTAQKQVDSIDMKAMREELKAVERLRKAADQLARQERDKPRDRGPER